jgi:hypothetical protein
MSSTQTQLFGYPKVILRAPGRKAPASAYGMGWEYAAIVAETFKCRGAEPCVERTSRLTFTVLQKFHTPFYTVGGAKRCMNEMEEGDSVRVVARPSQLPGTTATSILQR